MTSGWKECAEERSVSQSCREDKESTMYQLALRHVRRWSSEGRKINGLRVGTRVVVFCLGELNSLR
jgi:hypothetical protein